MNTTIKQIGFGLLIYPILSFSLSAQQSDSVASAFSNAFQVNFINESAVYYHFYLSGSSSVRVGVSVDWNYYETNPGAGTYRSFWAGSSPGSSESSYSSSGINNNYSVTTSALYVFPLNKSHALQFKLGIGPDFSYSYNRNSSTENTVRDSTRNEYTNTYTTKSYGFGVLACGQIIVPLYSSFQLVAEYHLIGNYVWQNYESFYNNSDFINAILTSSDGSQRKNESRGWQFSLNRITFGIIYSF
jgi:hypothetical protein